MKFPKTSFIIKPLFFKCSEIYFYFCIYCLAQQEVENQVHDILADTYETSGGGYSVPMQEIVKEVEFGLLTAGKHWMDKNVLLIEVLLKKLFPTAKPKKRKKKGNR